MSKRIRFEVLPAGDGGWEVTRDGIPTGSYVVKSIAVQHAVDRARQLLEQGRQSQLFIKGRNGQIQEERTYGADPEKTPG